MFTFCEETGISLDQLTAHSSSCELAQGFPFVSLARIDSNFLDFVDCHSRCSTQALNNRLRANSLLNMVFDFLQNLSSKHNDRCGAISNLSIL